MNSSRLVSRSLWVAVIPQVREGRLARPPCPEGGEEGSPDDGVHAPHLWCALEDTKRPGQGMALVRRGQSSPEDTNRLGAQGGHFPPEPYPPAAGWGGAVVVRTAVCRVGAILPVVDVEEGPHSRMPSPITARQGLKDTVEGRAADR